jgi:pimeloyl-ACP methyl ester carboxylesterase
VNSIERLTTAVLAAALGTAIVAAQSQKSIRGPLVLKDQGSFFVGGQTKALSPTSDITINQMYVQYQIPEDVGRHVPVVMVHGCCLSSKTWETTPDGRMGWSEYFVRQHRPVYLADQSGRARSGFDASVFNEVRAGTKPPTGQPNMLWADHQFAWRVFRFGPTFGTPWPDTQFPVAYIDELYKQMIPDLNATLPMPNPTWANMAALAVKLGGAILMGHSESSAFPAQAALADPTGVKGIIQLETGCLPNLTPEQYAILAKIPILIVVGDHFGTPQPPPACTTYLARITAAGGDITFDNLPELGIHGNSHMFMQDKNNLQLADLLLAWIDKHVEGTRKKSKV